MRGADFDRHDEADAQALYERLQRRLVPAPEPVRHPLSLYVAQAEALGL